MLPGPRLDAPGALGQTMARVSARWMMFKGNPPARTPDSHSDALAEVARGPRIVGTDWPQNRIPGPATSPSDRDVAVYVALGRDRCGKGRGRVTMGLE